jgi:hypothetical protein
VNARRGKGDEASTYTTESLLLEILALRGYAVALEAMRGHLYWLRDEACVKFHETRVERDLYLTWRITSKGTNVLDGTEALRGVASA